MIQRLFKPAAIFLFMFACTAPALGQFTWDGGGIDDNWTTGANWVGNVAPNPAGAGDLIFDGNVRLTPNADVAFIGITSLGFNATAGAFTISGGPLTTADPGVNAIPGFGTFIFNNGTATQTINNSIIAGDFDLALDAFEGDFIINGNINNNGFDVQLVGFNATNHINGVISGAGDLIKFETGSAVISGINTFTGDVDIQEGLLTLNGDFANTVAVNIDAAGTLSLGGDETIGSLAGAGTLMLNANELIVGDANSTNFAGVISGTGGLTKNGTGTLTLAGINTYTGATTVNNGSLQVDGDLADTTAVTVNTPGNFVLGGDETIASLAGDGNVNLNANTLTTGDANNTDFSGVMSGTGNLIKQGAGTFTLSGMNTFTGDTTLNAGVLDLTGTLAGDAFVAGGQFDLIGTVAGNVTLTTGTVNQTGMVGGNAILNGGMFNLNVGGNIAGDATINAGTLAVNGTVTGNVTNSAALNGMGTVGGTLTNNSGSTTSPGTNGTIAALNVTTNLVHNGGANLRADVSKDGGNAITNDQVIVGGTATLAANSRINVTDLNGGGVFAPGDTITLITTGAGVVDNGVRVFFPSMVVVFIPQINGNNFELLAVEPGDLAMDASGANNIALATAIDFDTPLAMGDYQAFINALDALGGGAPLDAALQQASPYAFSAIADTNLRTLQHHTSINANYLENRRLGLINPTQTTSNGAVPGTLQLASAANDPALLAWVLQGQVNPEVQDARQNARRFDEKYHVYGTAFGLFADQDTRVDYAGYSANVFGGQIGMDEWITDTIILGVMFAYDHTSIDFDTGGSADVNSIRFGPYLDWSDTSPGASSWFFNASVTYGFHLVDVDRTIAFAGFNGTPTTDFNSHDVSVYLGTGFDIEVPDVEITITPFASLQYTFYYTESFSESGGGGAELAVDSRSVHSLRTLLGVRARAVHEVGNLTFGSEGFVAYGREFLNDEELTGTFSNGTGFNQFTIDPNESSRNSFYFGAGLSTLLGESTSGFIRYEGEISADSSVHAIGLGLTFAF